jgi:hypothetical protein
LLRLLVGWFGGHGGDIGVDIVLKDFFDAASEQWVRRPMCAMTPIVASELEELPALGLSSSAVRR